MATTPQQIDVWRSAVSEDHVLEFKEAKQQFDFEKLCQYCVAIANENGGVLIFGIKNDLQPSRHVLDEIRWRSGTSS